jgi:hypothetical protein
VRVRGRGRGGRGVCWRGSPSPGVVGAVSPWQLAAAVTGGRLLAPAGLAVSINTSRPLGGAV